MIIIENNTASYRKTRENALIDLGIDHEFICLNRFSFLRSLSKIYAISSKEEILIFRAESALLFLLLRPFYVLLSSRIKVVLTGLGGNYYDRFTLKYKVLNIIFLIFFDNIIVQNSDDLDWLKSTNKFLMPGSGIDKVNNFDTKRKIDLIYAGRMLESKGYLSIIQAFQQARSKGYRGSLGLFGITQHDFEIKHGLLKDTSSIHFYGWKDLSIYLPEVRVLCMFSTYGEGCPRVVLEAISNGCLVIGNKFLGSEHIINYPGFHCSQNFQYTINDIEKMIFSVEKASIPDNLDVKNFVANEGLSSLSVYNTLVKF